MDMTEDEYKKRVEVPAHDQVMRTICREIFTLVEWTLVIAALTYVHERYASVAALIVSYALIVVLLFYVGNLVGVAFKTLVGKKNSFWIAVIVAGITGALATKGVSILVKDVVASNYDITTGEPEACPAVKTVEPVAAPKK